MDEKGLLHFFDDNQIAVIVAAQNEFLFETTEGKEYIANKFEFDWSVGHSDTAYTIISPEGRSQKVRGDDVVFVKTCLIKGDFYPPHQVIEKILDDEECEACGQSLHCTRLVKDPGLEDKIRVCNHCLMFLDGEAKHEGGGLEQCSGCPRTHCSAHPSYRSSGSQESELPF